jgi:1,4-dihydroxy-2-naphthoate octaprenyltransferase
MLKPWLLAARPKTLSASAVPVMMGSALAAHEPAAVTWWVFFCALFGAVLIQIATNLINDALDFRRGADTAERVGPVRVTQSGLITSESVLRAATVCLVLAALCGIPLIIRGGWPMLVIGVASIAAAWAYTGGPFPLAYHGMGEAFVMLFFGLVAVGGTFFAHSLQLTRAALAGGVAAGSLATVLLVINNLRDRESDAKSRKRTLVVLFGERFARAEILFFSLLPFAAVAVIAWLESLWWLLATLTTLPLAAAVVVRTYRSRGSDLNRCLALAGAQQWAFGLLFVLGSSF